MKKYLNRFIAYLLILVSCIAMLSGCGKKEAEANTLATKLLVQFNEEIKNEKDIEKVAEKLTENPLFNEVSMGYITVEEGYLNGFSEEITGFEKGVMFAPFIGSIPFVGYIFETDNPDALISTLKEKAMLNWNICTTADEMVVDKTDNYVFFVMAPNSFE